MNSNIHAEPPKSAPTMPAGRDCPACKYADSWGIPDKVCTVACQPTADGKGLNFVPLNSRPR